MSQKNNTAIMIKQLSKHDKIIHEYFTRFGDMPWEIADHPIVYFSIKAEPINHATLQIDESDNVKKLRNQI